MVHLIGLHETGVCRGQPEASDRLGKSKDSKAPSSSQRIAVLWWRLASAGTGTWPNRTLCPLVAVHGISPGLSHGEMCWMRRPTATQHMGGATVNSAGMPYREEEQAEHRMDWCQVKEGSCLRYEALNHRRSRSTDARPVLRSWLSIPYSCVNDAAARHLAPVSAVPLKLTLSFPLLNAAMASQPHVPQICRHLQVDSTSAVVYQRVWTPLNHRQRSSAAR